jgi:hypothetical protein
MQHRLPTLLAAAALALGFTSVVSASVGPLVITSVPSPFAACTIGGPGTVYVNAEVEPWVAVNPANPNNMIGVYQQDRWDNGGAHGLVAAVTHDGGATWAHSWAHFSLCSGGTAANGGDFDRATDPWVTFSPNGSAYQISLSFNANDFTNAVLVSKSTNGGLTWSEPATIIRDTSPFNFNDKESITADPTDSRFVYAVWDRSRHPGDPHSLSAFNAFSFRGDPYFARTTNGGASWEPARSMFTGGAKPTGNANLWTIGHQIVVQPNGTLIDIFNLSEGSGRQPSPNHSNQAVMRSTDKGATWSEPIAIAPWIAVALDDPDTGDFIRAGDFLPDIAVDPNTGALYAVWADGSQSAGAVADVVLSKSTDGGLTWSTPAKVSGTPAGVDSFSPSVDVSPSGTIAVTYFDLRNNTPDPNSLPTDYWIRFSTNGGSTWSAEQHVGGPFDMRTAPDAGGFFTGDYLGLDHTGNTFRPFFVMANTGNTANRTDAFATTATP